MSDITWSNDTATLGSLAPWERNPKRISKTHAKRLLDYWHKVGQFQSIAVGPDGEVYDGHQRLSVLMAAHGKGYTVDVRRASRALTDDERRELVIAAHVGTTGQFNWDELSGWDASELQAWGMDGELLQDWRTDIAGLDAMLKAEQPAMGEDPGAQVDKAAELQAKWQTATGQLWQLGEHRLICGDCTDAAVVARVMGGEKANMLCWDPPFNVGFDYDGEYKGQDNKSIEEYGVFLGSGLLSFHSVANRDHTVFVWQGMLNVRHFARWFADYDWRLISIAKGFVQARPTWLQWATDPVVAWCTFDAKKPISHRDFFYNGQSANTRQTTDRAISGNHPCPRSLEVVEYFVDGWAELGEIVVDLTSGSGTTIMACERLGRRCRAVEIEPGYVAVCLERFYQMTGKTPVLLAHSSSGEAVDNAA